MRSLIIAIAVTLSLVHVCPADGTAPDFSWGGSTPVKTALKQAQAKWQEAASVPSSPDWLKSQTAKTFDEEYMTEVMSCKDYSYSLLDIGMTKLKRLDECRIAYMKALALAGDKAPRSARRFDDAYYHLKSEIRLAIGLSRAEIAREMMGSDDSGYCFQAMEAAIDALRDSADDAQKVPNGAARADRIRKFRASLFAAWDAAERAKNTDLIGAIDLPKAWSDAGLGAKQTDKK